VCVAVLFEEREFFRFWKQYGKYIKLGVIEDGEYRKKLVNLLRFKSSKTVEQDPNDYTVCLFLSLNESPN